MARKKTPTVRLNVKTQLSHRLREVRQDLFGEHGGPELARQLNLPARTWYNYETGVTVPAEILLSFIEQTRTNPVWLLNGEGPKYRDSVQDMVLEGLSPVDLIRRGLEKLEQQPRAVQLVAPEDLPAERISDYLAVDLVPLHTLTEPIAPRSSQQVLAFRRWIPHPRETVAVRIDDDAMHPVLPRGSAVAIDRSERDPERLHGRLVAAAPEGQPMIRWLEVSGRHLILRPNQAHADFPLIPLELHDGASTPILGQVVWSWSRFAEV